MCLSKLYNKSIALLPKKNLTNIWGEINEWVIHDTNLMAFKTDLGNVNWNTINIPQKQIQNTKHVLKYSQGYTKNTFL